MPPSFAPIQARAAARKGGKAALRRLLPETKSAAQLRRIPDDRWLAEMTRRVFCSGFVWKIVDHKWPAFEKAFLRFRPAAVAHMSDEALERLAGDPAVIRHYRKILSVRDNALFVQEIAREHGSFGRFVAAWPEDDIVGLWRLLRLRGSRLGGFTGPYCLRFMGKDTFLLTPDVVACLRLHEVIGTEHPGSRRDLQRIQDCFSHWRAETGLGLAALSRIAACSMD